MADPISTASGVLALALFAFKSSTVLYQLVDSFRSNQRTVRELKEELEALNGVLQSLQETIPGADVDLTTLKLPLLRCGKACKDFEAVIIKCTAHSSESRTSFRDWAKLKYLGDDIAGFKNMLAGYKSTISIALSHVNMRTAIITTNVLKEYKEMISNTTCDLEEHLEQIDDKLRAISVPGTGISDEHMAERQQIQEERNGTQHCLDICTQVLSQIDQVQPNAFVNLSSTYIPPVTTLSGLASAQQLTSITFKACKERLTDTTARLERQLQDINNRLARFPSQSASMSNEYAAEQERMQEERDAIKQSLAICAEASIEANQEKSNVYEDISLVDDSQQVIISTVGALISARRVTGGSRSFQVFGQMSDDSFQLLSRRIGVDKTTEPPTKVDPVFENRYGSGVKLSGQNLKGGGAATK
ncbi:hypothetical protein BGZ60DRAFT_390547 [Tricladium varicosporioides]|nr:hypothetical protein BGZ60DRAFT_390547 [Hymenoscyphus varicosporioides]